MLCAFWSLAEAKAIHFAAVQQPGDQELEVHGVQDVQPPAETGLVDVNLASAKASVAACIDMLVLQLRAIASMLAVLFIGD